MIFIYPVVTTICIMVICCKLSFKFSILIASCWTLFCIMSCSGATLYVRYMWNKDYSLTYLISLLFKGKKLREASQQELFYRALEDANAKLDEMEKLVSSDDVGHDLRSVRALLNKHQVFVCCLINHDHTFSSLMSWLMDRVQSVSRCRVQLVLGWLTASRWVNHLGM